MFMKEMKRSLEFNQLTHRNKLSNVSKPLLYSEVQVVLAVT